MSRGEMFSGVLQRRVIAYSAAPHFAYYAGGSGSDVLMIVNAYGQSLAFWEPLVERLAQCCRIVIWQPRGSVSEHGGLACAHDVADHADDMKHLMDAEGIAGAHLLGWCSGPKTAMAFQAAWPQRVRSMIFLTGCFVADKVYTPFLTRYETTMMELCRLIDQRPAAAMQMADIFGKVLFGQRRTMPSTAVSERIASLVQAPFRTPESIVHYARQLLAFWSVDSSGVLPRIGAPTLFVGGECDDVAHPKLSREMARLVPDAVYAEVVGGSHYLQYDSPALLACVVEDFLRDGIALSARGGEVELDRFPE